MVPLQKILVMSSGSRGDIQPYVAMACVLKEAGYHVECATCHNHAKLVTECGLPFHGCFADSEKAVREQDALKKSMAEGDAMAFIRGLNEVVREGAEPTLLHWLGIVEKLKPDLILVGSLTDYYGALARYKLGIPTLDVKLQCLSTRPQRMIFGLPNLPCGLNSWVVRNVLIAGVYKGWQKDLDPWALKHLGCRLCDSYTWELFLADCDKPTVSPVVVCQASRFGDVLYPERPAGVVLIGQCVIDREAQERLARGNGADNFGDEDALAKIEAFIAHGDRPVYMGWGSMICKSPEYMAELAVRALMRSGLRAIIQGGWAHLSMETLARATSNEALLQYAAGNVLFVEKAPHEWLFPRCACTVHHGGAGTIAAAVRAGVPTIVTPVFLDQYDHAYLVNQLGVGFGFASQLQKIRADDLGDTIRSVVGSSEVAARAKSVGKEIRAEDGASAIVDVVQKFWSDYVETGRLKASVSERLHRPNTSFFGWLGNMCAEGICGGRQAKRPRELQPWAQRFVHIRPKGSREHQLEGSGNSRRRLRSAQSGTVTPERFAPEVIHW